MANCGSGGYCVLPPSRHPDGGAYRWLIPIDGGIPRVELSETGFLPSNTEDTDSNSNEHHHLDSCLEFSTFSVSSGCSAPSVLQEAIRAAMERTLPSGPGQRHRLLFRLARELKAIPALSDRPVSDLKPIIQEWHQLAKPFIRTQP